MSNQVQHETIIGGMELSRKFRMRGCKNAVSEGLARHARRKSAVVIGVLAALFIGAVADRANAEPITFSIEDSAVHSYFSGTPHEMTVQVRHPWSRGSTTLELEYGIPVRDWFIYLDMSVGLWPGGCGYGLSDTQTLDYAVEVGTERVQTSLELKMEWICNNQGMFTLYPTAPIEIDLGPKGTLTITPDPQVQRGQFPEFYSGGAVPKATFLLERGHGNNGDNVKDKNKDKKNDETGEAN